VDTEIHNIFLAFHKCCHPYCELQYISDLQHSWTLSCTKQTTFYYQWELPGRGSVHWWHPVFLFSRATHPTVVLRPFTLLAWSDLLDDCNKPDPRIALPSFIAVPATTPPRWPQHVKTPQPSLVNKRVTTNCLLRVVVPSSAAFPALGQLNFKPWAIYCHCMSFVVQRTDACQVHKLPLHSL
jgi:hypothetical protein